MTNETLNLADPDFEPSDEQLIGLSARAFAGVRRQHEQALDELRRRILADRERNLRALAQRMGLPEAR